MCEYDNETFDFLLVLFRFYIFAWNRDGRKKILNILQTGDEEDVNCYISIVKTKQYDE